MAVSFITTLCDSDADGFDGHRDLEISAVEVAQKEAVIDSANAFCAGRGNSEFTVRFAASKRHADVAAAVVYCGSHAEGTRGTAAFSGFGLTLDDATCNVTVRQKGVTTEASYVITGTKTPA